ncbi:MAG: PilZ domain-containing protein [Gemmataceae bacterium]|nr:PilZ domain-containing protein [Gemmataceae bacterium]MDW8263946.1 PilZ domain-containing protein [Gemmataceae bacterium]
MSNQPHAFAMRADNIQTVVQRIVLRAEKEGAVSLREVRAELAAAGLAESLAKEVIAAAGPSLEYRGGRYHFVPPGSARMRLRARQDEALRRKIHRAVRQLVGQYRTPMIAEERRDRPRTDLVEPVQAQAENGPLLHLLSRDISLSGVRFLSSYQLAGQKLRVWIPRPSASKESYCFLVHVLWSAQVADGIYESGAVFLALEEAQPPPLKLTEP